MLTKKKILIFCVRIFIIPAFFILQVHADNAVVASLQEEVSTASFLSHLDASSNNVIKDSTKLSGDKKESFYDDYLAKYWPKALLMRGKFLSKMLPHELDLALDDFVTLFKSEPGFYFSNDPKRIKIGFYLEVIVGQFSLISEFLKKAHIDLASQEIFIYEPLLFGIGSSRINCTFLRKMKKGEKNLAKPLINYLKSERLFAIIRFYAAYFDFLIRLFNEAILFGDLKKAQKYQHELEFVITKLRNSEMERLYEEPLKVSKELLNLLRAQITRQDQEDQEDRKDGYSAGGAY